MLTMKYNKCQERKIICFIQYRSLSVQNCLFNFHGLRSLRAFFFLWELFHTLTKLIRSSLQDFFQMQRQELKVHFLSPEVPQYLFSSIPKPYQHKFGLILMSQMNTYQNDTVLQLMQQHKMYCSCF